MRYRFDADYDSSVCCVGSAASAKPTVRRPRLLAIPTFDEWLADAFTDGKEGTCVDDDAAAVNEYVTRFNRDVASLVATHGEERINKAIWYIYGSASGYMWDAMDESLGQRRIEFMASVRDLYASGFASFCAQHFGHLDCGPEVARPMNSACYMLWDMDGIDWAINADAQMLEASLDVLTFALELDNWACNESALHGLGHLATDFRAQSSPPITAFLRRKDIPPELREYAKAAKAGSVL